MTTDSNFGISRWSLVLEKEFTVTFGYEIAACVYPLFLMPFSSTLSSYVWGTFLALILSLNDTENAQCFLAWPFPNLLYTLRWSRHWLLWSRKVRCSLDYGNSWCSGLAVLVVRYCIRWWHKGCFLDQLCSTDFLKKIFI